MVQRHDGPWRQDEVEVDAAQVLRPQGVFQNPNHLGRVFCLNGRFGKVGRMLLAK
jgi:hypothetical protein